MKKQEKKLRTIYFDVPEEVLQSKEGFPPIHKVTLSDGREVSGNGKQDKFGKWYIELELTDEEYRGLS